MKSYVANYSRHAYLAILYFYYLAGYPAIYHSLPCNRTPRRERMGKWTRKESYRRSTARWNRSNLRRFQPLANCRIGRILVKIGGERWDRETLMIIFGRNHRINFNYYCIQIVNTLNRCNFEKNNFRSTNERSLETLLLKTFLRLFLSRLPVSEISLRK